MIVNFMQQAEAQNNATLPTHNKGDMGNNHTGSADVKSEDIPGKLYVTLQFATVCLKTRIYKCLLNNFLHLLLLNKLQNIIIVTCYLNFEVRHHEAL